MELVTVYVHLLNEGTTVLRPVPSLEVDDNIFRLQKTEDYDPEDEEWEFTPGSVVSCEREFHDRELILVAKRLAKL